MAKKTIILKNRSNAFEEYVATAVAIIPGYLLEVTSAGLVQAHSTAGGGALPMFAVEDQLQGGLIATAYAVSARIPQCWIPQRGDEVYALLANGETVVVGDKLVSNGAGKLKKATADSSAVVIEEFVLAIALEAVDMSGSSGEDPTGRIEIRIN